MSAFVASSELDQVGDVGRVKRLDEAASSLVIAFVDRVQHLVDEFRAEPVFLVDGGVGIVLGKVGELVVFGHVAPFTCTRCSTPMGEPALAQPPERS